MNRPMKHFLLFAAACAFAVSGSAQCRTFTKKNCMGPLEGYVANDNYNSAILIPGDEAELMLTFLGGRDYRVNVCAHPVLGKVKFDIFDTRGKLLFSSDHANGKTFVDFKMATTQQLMVRVSVPASKSAILHEGCLTVLIGSKP